MDGTNSFIHIKKNPHTNFNMILVTLRNFPVGSKPTLSLPLIAQAISFYTFQRYAPDPSFRALCQYYITTIRLTPTTHRGAHKYTLPRGRRSITNINHTVNLYCIYILSLSRLSIPSRGEMGLGVIPFQSNLLMAQAIQAEAATSNPRGEVVRPSPAAS